jgi:hypothetical protein
MAPLCSGDVDSTGLPPMDLPMVTTVFCAVDGAKSYASRHWKDSLQVHEELRAVFRSILRQVFVQFLFVLAFDASCKLYAIL